MKKEKILSKLISVAIVLVIMSANLLFPIQIIAASLTNWRQEVRSYAAGYGFIVNGKYEQKWLFFDTINPQTYEDIYCIRSGDRQNKEYVEEDLYNISEEDKNKLFDTEDDYLHFMWILENMYLYGEQNVDKLNNYKNLIGINKLPYAENDMIDNKLILQDGAKVTGEKYPVSKNEQIIKVVQNEMLLQLVHQNYERKTDIEGGIVDNNLNKLTGDADTLVKRIVDTLYKDKSKYAGYTVNNKNKNFGKAGYEGKVTIDAIDTVNDTDANWANGVSGKFSVNNKYNSKITDFKVYINNNEVSGTNYQVFDMSGNEITSDVCDRLTKYASANKYEFRIKYNGKTNGTDKIKVELGVDYGTITKAYLIKPKEDKSFIDGKNKNNQYLINVSRQGEKDTISTEQKEEKAKVFDLALTKEIVKVAYPETSLNKLDINYERLKDIDLYKLRLQKENTARYIMDKSAVDVEEGCIVTYKITVYNEGNINGYAQEITDYLPDGLELAPNSTVNSDNHWQSGGNGIIKSNHLSKEIDNTKIINAFDGTTLSSQEILLECIVKPTDGMKAKLQTGEKLELDNRAEISKYGYYNETGVFIPANELHIDVDSVQNSVYTNANTNDRGTLISLIKDIIENAKKDVKNVGEVQIDKAIIQYEDDDDVERLILKQDARKFDLALRKWIVAVNGNELLDEEGKPQREPTQRSEFDENCNQLLKTKLLRENTLNYTNPKDAIEVHNGDLVTYRIAIFNEGDIAGYAQEVTDYLPVGLEYVENNPINNENEWDAEKNEDGITVVKTKKLAKENAQKLTGEVADKLGKNETENIISDILSYLLLSGFEIENVAKPYKTLDIVCRVNDDVKDKYLTNRAEITEYLYYEYDSDGKAVKREAKDEGVDRDSEENTIQDELYLDFWYYDHFDEVNPVDYYAGVQDDDDFETVYVTYVKKDTTFDLSLRKFISAVNDVQLLGSQSRAPEPDVTKLVTGEAVTAEYNNQDKIPLVVNPKDIVEYTLRIYNEGEQDGYAKLVMDDVPKEVEMVKPIYSETGEPQNLNATYRWIMYKEANGNETSEQLANSIEYNLKKYVVTNNEKEAQIIVTDYLSKEVNSEENLIKSFDKQTKELSYKDIKVQFKAKPNRDENNIIINYAQITEDTDSEGNPVEDRDSTPNKWEESPRDDDQDIEKISVNYFDLALYKWVSSVIVTEDGKTTEYSSQHSQEDKTYVVNIPIKKEKLNSTVVKFKYKIMVENQGPLEGYAKEIKDHIPEGLKFVEEDNKAYGWKQLDDNTIVTDYLKDTLLKFEDTAEIEVVLTWINGSENLGKKINYAEISKDYNDYDDADDSDSEPDNFEKVVMEDDEDEDEVMLTIKTGSGNSINIALVLGVLGILAGGCLGIKEFVVINNKQ